MLSTFSYYGCDYIPQGIGDKSVKTKVSLTLKSSFILYDYVNFINSVQFNRYIRTTPREKHIIKSVCYNQGNLCKGGFYHKENPNKNRGSLKRAWNGTEGIGGINGDF